MKLARKEHRGYTPLYAENLDPTSTSKGDSKESFYIGPLEDITTVVDLNQWPSEEVLTSWRHTMESFYRKVLSAGKKLLSLLALALNEDEDFFEKVGALDKPSAFLRLLHYPGLVARFTYKAHIVHKSKPHTHIYIKPTIYIYFCLIITNVYLDLFLSFSSCFVGGGGLCHSILHFFFFAKSYLVASLIGL
ncbi:2-oxoglutarate-dependent dioxygenase ecdK-like isoform X2 [Corylus avellana]|nr:2-oxoglutarate-dependent dioxygenase ecdK-like isoform X2 [Corylus avellana]